VVFELKAQDARITWTVRVKDGGMTMDFRGEGAGLAKLDALELIFPFDASATATCPFPSEWSKDGKLIFPALLHAPDLGIVRVSCPQKPALPASWQGRREFLSTTLTLELPVPTGAAR
jgi:hypothetical protein